MASIQARFRLLTSTAVILALLVPAGAALAAKTGSLDITSTEIGTRVYVDDEYRGDANIFIENVPVGERTVTCRQGSRRLARTFTLHENETLRLEARFDEGRIVDLSVEKKDSDKRKQELAEQEKARQQQAERERAAKRAEAPPPRPQAPPAVDERALHRDLFSVTFDYTSSNAFSAAPVVNARILQAFSAKKDQTGTFTRAKGNALTCKTLPCTATWSASFTYIDEKGAKASFKITWSETTFEYVTLDGLSKREWEWCVEKNCLRFQDPDRYKNNPSPAIDRYVMTWTKDSLSIRRSDLAR